MLNINLNEIRNNMEVFRVNNKYKFTFLREKKY